MLILPGRKTSMLLLLLLFLISVMYLEILCIFILKNGVFWNSNDTKCLKSWLKFINKMQIFCHNLHLPVWVLFSGIPGEKGGARWIPVFSFRFVPGSSTLYCLGQAWVNSMRDMIHLLWGDFCVRP